MSEPPAWEPPAAPGAGAPPGWGSPPPGAGWAPPPDWSPAPPARPGVVPLRPLGVGEILDGAFTTVRRHPRATLGVAAVVTVAQLSLSLLAAAASGEPLVSSFRPRAGLDLRPDITWPGMLSAVIGAITGAVLTAMVAVVVADAVLGRPTGAGAAWRRVRPLLWRVLAVGALAGIGPILGLLLLVLPGVFLWGAWALAVPAAVLERTSVPDALRRSWRLAVPDWWRVWGTRALSVLLGALVAFLLSIPALLYGAVSLFRTAPVDPTVGVGPVVALTITSAVTSIVVAPFLAAVLALLYVDRRMRAEGLDVTLARSAGR